MHSVSRLKPFGQLSCFVKQVAYNHFALQKQDFVTYLLSVYFYNNDGNNVCIEYITSNLKRKITNLAEDVYP